MGAASTTTCSPLPWCCLLMLRQHHIQHISMTNPCNCKKAAGYYLAGCIYAYISCRKLRYCSCSCVGSFWDCRNDAQCASNSLCCCRRHNACVEPGGRGSPCSQAAPAPDWMMGASSQQCYKHTLTAYASVLLSSHVCMCPPSTTPEQPHSSDFAKCQKEKQVKHVMQAAAVPAMHAPNTPQRLPRELGSNNALRGKVMATNSGVTGQNQLTPASSCLSKTGRLTRGSHSC
jgi:hypothetical protein